MISRAPPSVLALTTRRSRSSPVTRPMMNRLPRDVSSIWRIGATTCSGNTDAPTTSASIGLRLVASLQPIAMLYVGKLIIDEVVRLTDLTAPGPAFADWWASGTLSPIIGLLALELILVRSAMVEADKNQQ